MASNGSLELEVNIDTERVAKVDVIYCITIYNILYLLLYSFKYF